MPKCVYCQKMYEIPKGLTLIMKDGTINHLCSAKCRKNMAMKRRKVRWILKAKKSKEELQKEVLARSEEAREEHIEAPKEEVKEKEKTHKEEPKKEEKPKEEKKEESKKK